MNSIYTRIDPQDFEVSEAVKLLNYNLDYVYELAKGLDKGNNTSITNIIPHADFNIISNLKYWGTLESSSKVFFQDGLLKVTSNSNSINLVSPVFSESIKAFQKYTLLLQSRTDNKQSLYINNAYILHEDNTKTPLKVYTEVDTKDFIEYSLVFENDVDIINGRLVLISNNIPQDSTSTFKYTDNLNKNFFNDLGYIKSSYNLDTGTNKVKDVIYKLIDTIKYYFNTNQRDKLQEVEENKVEDGQVKIIPSIYDDKDKKYKLISNLEQFIYTELKFDNEENIQEELKIIAYYFNNSKIKGAFPILCDSDKYSLLSTMYVHRIVNKYITKYGDLEIEDINNKKVTLATIQDDIEIFIDKYKQDILSEYIKGGFVYIESDSGEAYNLEFKYLNEDNTLSSTQISLISMYDLMRLFSYLPLSTEEYHNNIVNLYGYTIPNTINLRGEAIGNYNVDVLYYIHFYKVISDKAYKNEYLNLILEYKQSNGLYKVDNDSSSKEYSNSQYLDSMLDSTEIYQDYSIYFQTISIGKGVNNSIVNKPDSNYNSIIEQIRNVKVDIDEDSILAIAEERFIEKTYYKEQLQSIYSAIKAASVEVNMDSIIAQVVGSKQFVDLTNNVNVVKELAQENKSSLEMLDDKIEMSVQESKLQVYLAQSSSLGINLVQNSCFLRGLDNFTQQGPAGQIVETSQGRVYYKILTSQVFSLRQEISYNLYEGDYVVGLDVYGSGSITINIYNSTNNSLISSNVISPELSTSKRYYTTFKVKDITKVDLEIYSENADLSFGYIKLSRGTEDYGWTLSSDDTNYLSGSIKDCYEKIIKYYTNVIIDEDINDVINNLELKCSQLSSITNITLTHPILNASSVLTNTSEYLSLFIESYTDLVSYLRDSEDKTYLNDKTSTFYKSFTKLVNSLVVIIDYISNYDTSKSTSVYIESIQQDLLDVNTNMENLNTNLIEFFQDGILTSEEKAILRNNLSVLEREKAELDVRVNYYTTQDTIKDSEDVTLLSECYNNYNVVYQDIVNLINDILDKDEVTQDLKYAFNAKYEVYKQHAKALQEQLLKVVSKYTSTQTQLEIRKVEEKISDLDSDLNTLKGLVGDVSSDGILTTLEKRSLKNQLQEITHAYLNIKAEIDYYQAQDTLKGSSEISSLNSLESQLDSSYNTVNSEINRLLEGNTITEEDVVRVDGYISNVSSKLQDLQSAISNCLLKITAVETSKEINSLNTQINGIQDSVDSLVDFTNEAWLDGILSYTEAISLIDLVSRIKLQIQVFLDRVDTLLVNDYIKNNNTLVEKLGNAKRDVDTSFTNMETVISSISSDGTITEDEKTQFNTALNNFYSKLNYLRGVISEAENIIIQGESNKAYEQSKKYIDDNYKDVKDTVNKMNTFADEAWVDGIITKAESVTFTNLLDNLYKESLDMKKQAEVYTSAVLTPELQGTSELGRLVTALASYESAYNIFYDAVEEIANFPGVTSKDKTAYNNSKNDYEEALVKLVQSLLECSKKVSEVKTNNALGFTDKDGNTTTVVDWVKNADIELTKEKIKMYVENTSTVLVTSTFIENNYLTKSEVENTYATKSQISLLDNQISLSVKSSEMESYKQDFLTDSKSYTDTKVANANNTNTKSLDIYFYLSTSPTELIGGSWSTTAPQWEDGKYMWQKVVTTLGNGATRESQPTCISGAQGPKGEDGKDGTSFKIIGSYNTLDELKVAHPTNEIGNAYMVGENIYIWTGTDYLNLGPIKGADGQDGEDGKDGQTPYVHMKYSNDNGATFTANAGETPGEYLGTKVDFIKEDSATPSDYTWVKVKGEPGVDGIDGLDAKILTLSANRYAIAYDNTNNVKDSSDIVLTVNQQNFEDSITWSTNPSITLSGYGLSRTLATSNFNDNNKVVITVSAGGLTDTVTIVKVKDGDKGEQGISIVSVDVEYGISSSATTMPTLWDTTSPSWKEGKFIWSRVKTTYSDNSIDYSDSVCISGADGRSITSIKEQYYLSTSSTALTGGSWQDFSPSWEEGKYIWTRSIIAYSIGGSTTTSPICVSGNHGKDSYNVILTNESHTFAGNETSAIPSIATTQVVGYKGSTQVAVSIGDITGQPTGMNVTVQNNNSTSASVKIEVDTSMITKNGTLMIPVTIEDVTVNKIFTYSLSLKGKGGQSVDKVVEEYALGTSADTAPTSGWSTVCPVWEPGKYLWSRLRLEYKNPVKTEYAGYYVDTSWQAINEIKIGGRNLLTKSGNFKGDTGSWTSNGATLTLDSSVTYGGYSTIKIVGNDGTTNNTWIQLKPNTTYTYSVLAKASSAITDNNTNPLHMWLNKTQAVGHLEIIVSHNSTINTSWTKAHVVFKTPNEASVYYMKPFIYGIGNATVWLVNAKVEEGNVPTDWTPAPEDTETYVDDAIYTLQNDLESQIDNKVETFNQTNDPSSSWTTTEDKTKHTGDLWYNNTETKRWSGTKWVSITDKSLQQLASSKAQVFTGQPVTPYYKGDLWITSLDGTGVVKTCKTTRTSGNFTANDWAEGLKYTDDTKANEVNNNLVANYVTVSNYNSGIDITKKNILSTVSQEYATKSSVTDLSNNLTNNYSTTSAMNSAINQKGDSILSTVSNTYTTKADFNSLSIGGRNYYTKTSNMYLLTSEGTITRDNSINGFVLTADSNGNVFCRIVCIWEGYKYYTVSGYFKADTQCNAHMDVCDYDIGNKSVPTTYTKFSGTAYVDRATDNIYNFVDIECRGIGAGNKVYIKDFKVEEGQKATSWSPAPEDINASITAVDNKFVNYSTTQQMNSAINQKANEINLNVSNTYATKSSVTDLSNNLTNNYSTTQQMNSAIDIAKSGIKLDVSQNYASKHEVAHYFEGENKWKLDVYSLGSMSANAYPTKETMIQNNCQYQRSYLVEHPSYEGEHYGDNYVGYATTYMHFTTDYQWNGRVVTDDNGNVYLNDVLVLSTPTCQWTNITLNFKAGWNKLEVLYAEGGGGDGWQFDSEIVVVPGGVMNKMNCYGQNSTEEYIKANYSTIQQMNSAIDQKANEITSSVSQAYSTKAETSNQIDNLQGQINNTNNNISNNYASKSELQQTTNSITAKFSESGGYNLLRNGRALNGTNYWADNGGGLNVSSSNPPTVDYKYFYTNLPAGMTYNGWVQLENNTHYIYSAKIFVATSITGNKLGPLHYWCSSDQTVSKNQATLVRSSHDGQTIPANKWVDVWVEYLTASSGAVWFKPFIYYEGSSCAISVTDLMLCKGSIPSPYSPHPSEVYDGITQIDKDGIKVYHGSIDGQNYTHMAPTGFYINNKGEDVFRVDTNGLYLKGNVTITNGSVPSSLLSGQISDGLIGEWIKNGATNGSNAKATLDNNAGKWNSTTDRVNGSSAAWDNAYNRVVDWAYGSVGGTTTINGGLIEANTIAANQIAIGDFTNYSQLVKGKNLTNAHGTAAWNENNMEWYSTSNYFPFTSDYTKNIFATGDQVNFDFDLWIGEDKSMTIGVWFYNDENGSSSYLTNSTTSVAFKTGYNHYNVNLTIPTNDNIKKAKSMQILINNNGTYVAVRNVVIRRRVTGNLIVDGSITADKIAANAITGKNISGGTINIGNGVFVVDAKGQIKAKTVPNSKGQYLDMSSSTYKIYKNSGTLAMQIGFRDLVFEGGNVNYSTPSIFMGADGINAEGSAGWDSHSGRYYSRYYVTDNNGPTGDGHNGQPAMHFEFNTQYTDTDTGYAIPSKFKFYADGHMRISPVRDLEIYSYSNNGEVDSKGNEYLLAKFYSSNSNLYSSALDIPAVINTRRGDGILIADRSHAVDGVSYDGNTNIMAALNIVAWHGENGNDYRYVRPYLDGNHGLGSADRRWGKIYSSYGTVDTSDRRCKTNINYLSPSNTKAPNKCIVSKEDIWNFIKDIDYASYNFIDSETGNTEVDNQFGFILQDLIQSNPDISNNLLLDSSCKNNSDAKDSPLMGYNKGNYINMLGCALQQAMKKIELLEEKIKNIEES